MKAPWKQSTTATTATVLDKEPSISKPSFTEQYNNLLSRPWVTSYRLLGERVARLVPLLEDLRPNLLRSGKRIHFEAYVSLILFTSIIAFAVGFSATTIIGLALQGAPPLVLLLGLAIGLVSAVAGFGVTYSLPSINAGSRKGNLDVELPYAMSQMAVLASAGSPPERIFRSLAQSDEKKSVVAEEARMILRDVDILGFDLLAALASERDRSPSKTFSDFLEGFTATTRSGGDLKKYLLSSAKEIMELKRIAGKQLVEMLGMLAEAYVSMLVVFPLIIIIMFSVMGLVGGGLGGISVFGIMALTAYAVIPLLAILMLVLLDQTLPRE
jgi:flagellar protein FlaJ